MNYAENDVESILFRLLKTNVIQTAMSEKSKEVFLIHDHGALLLTAMAAIALNEPLFRDKIKGVGTSFNYPKNF